VSLSRIHWSGEDCVLITLKDVTSNKLVIEKNILDRIKGMIFKSFSHEMHTPLNGIVLNLQTSKDLIRKQKDAMPQLQASLSCSLILQSIMQDFMDYQHL